MIPKRKFSDLLKTVGSVPGLKRLRFVTSHPRYMSLGVVDAVAETPAACENFHIPFQSGSNEILNSMGRGHTREKYLHIVDRIRSVSLLVSDTKNLVRSTKLMAALSVDVAHPRCFNHGRRDRRISWGNRATVSRNTKFDGGGGF
jgi:hypothetical protein